MRNRFWEKGRRTPEKDLSTIFLVLAISVAVSNLGIGIISPLLPVYAKRMGADGVLVGLIFPAFPSPV